MSSQTLLLARLNAKHRQDEAFNSWYNDVHVPDVLAMRGVRAIKRYQWASAQFPGRALSPHRYLAICDTSDEAAFTLDLNAGHGSDRMRSSSAVDDRDPAVFFYSSVDHPDAPDRSTSTSRDILLVEAREGARGGRGIEEAAEQLLHLSQALDAGPGILLRRPRHWHSVERKPDHDVIGLIGDIDAGALGPILGDRRVAAAMDHWAQCTLYEALTGWVHKAPRPV